ncbi:MAG TPA: hypothetical protein VMM17_11865 [Gemmatimonadaceae bacterium]|nr:hypothetical protein [Gemmatimonadaceae bacterium]
MFRYRLRAHLVGEAPPPAALESTDTFVLFYDLGDVVHTTTPGVLLPVLPDGFYLVDAIDREQLDSGAELTTVQVLPAGRQLGELPHIRMQS